MNTEELERKIKLELTEKNEVLQSSFNNLVRENFGLKKSVLELKGSVAKLDLENTDLKKRSQKAEEKFSQIEKNNSRFEENS